MDTTLYPGACPGLHELDDDPHLGVPDLAGRLGLLSFMATTFLYRCPYSHQNVQGWSAEDVSDDDASYHSVACLTCAQTHLINLKTGKMLGAKED